MQFYSLLTTHYKLDCYRCLDRRMWIVIFEREILEFEIENRFYFGVQGHFWQGLRRARKLLLRLLQVVRIDVYIPERVHEFPGLKPGHLCHHHREKRVRGDVKGDAKE